MSASQVSRLFLSPSQRNKNYRIRIMINTGRSAYTTTTFRLINNNINFIRPCLTVILKQIWIITYITTEAHEP